MPGTPKSRYPSWDVMSQRLEWDSHTQDVVVQRLHPPSPGNIPEHLVRVLAAVSKSITGDERPEPIAYALNHVASKLVESWKEPQLKIGCPPLDELIIDGLDHADGLSGGCLGRGALDPFSVEMADVMGKWADGPHSESLSVLRGMVIEAYASHPVVWSDMGYAGPAYPRGYLRMELGLTEPWEAHGDA